MRIGAADGASQRDPPRSALQSPRERGRVVAVYSPCGGVGTTITAVNLADRAAAGTDGAVALVEMRPAPGEFARLLRVKPLYMLDDVCAHWERLERNIFRSAMCRHPRGFDVLCQGGDPAGGGIPHVRLSSLVVRGIVRELRQAYALSVIELDRTLAMRQIEVMRAADVVLLLVRPDAPSVRRACWAIKTAKSMHVPHERFALVLARSGRRDQLTSTTIERAFRLAVVAQIPESPQAVGHAVGDGRGLIDGPGSSRLAACLKRLAQSLTSELPLPTAVRG